MGRAFIDSAASCAQAFTVEYEGGSEKIWIRTPTQADLDRAREKVAEKRVEVRRKYLPGTPLYEDATNSLSLTTPEELAQLILSERREDIEERIKASISRPIEPDWDKYKSATTLEKAQSDHETRMNAYAAEVMDKTNKTLADEIESLVAKPKEELVSEAAIPYMRTILDVAGTQTFNDYYIFSSVFDGEDRKTPYFESVDEVAELPDHIKVMLRRAIMELPNISQVDIKNSQGKSVSPSGFAESTPAVTKDLSTEA